ncbi:MAG: hypothetical protein IKJ13_05030 [Clostridia bacterium]|nr:hypothetical protein [Clostridia bacterium]MBO5316609.1 hypothetical protein [Clostridia bacterium]MBR3806183.1 hypothetical protein [Clostridia bacterium]
MKKIVSGILVCVMLIGCVFALASCGKTLNGSYADELTGLTTYTFEGNKVTVSVGAGNFAKTFEGTYEIKTNDKEEEVIAFTFEGDGSDKYTGEYAFVEGTEGDKEYIKIGIAKYIKK